MAKTNIYKRFGIPESLAVTFTLFSLTLFLSPYFAGTNFGILKIPFFSIGVVNVLRWLGPLAFLLTVCGFFPLLPESRPPGAVTDTVGSDEQQAASHRQSQSDSASSADERLQQLKEEMADLASPMPSLAQYYFYISKDKIAKLEIESEAATASLEQTIRSTLATVGTSERMTVEYQKRCEQLAGVLRRLGQSEAVADLTTTERLPPLAGWAYAETQLHVARKEAKVLILEGQLGGLVLQLACSKDSFLDYDPVRNELIISSTSHWFFAENHKYTFRTHFLILSVDEGYCINGSPLYLSLPTGILE